MCPAGSVFAGHVVAIDACVQRRPPAAKLEHEDEAVDRLAQLVGFCLVDSLDNMELRRGFLSRQSMDEVHVA